MDVPYEVWESREAVAHWRDDPKKRLDCAEMDPTDDNIRERFRNYEI